MINKIYSPIINFNTKNNFCHYVASLKIPQIDYFAIGLQNIITQQSISLMSSEEWQTYFINNQLAEHDPIRKASLNTSRKIIPFNQIDYLDNYGKEIMHQRAKCGIKNGIVLMERNINHNYIITLGTGYLQFNSFDFLRRYHDKIKLIKDVELPPLNRTTYLPFATLKN